MTVGGWALGLLCLLGIGAVPYLGARGLVNRFLPATVGAVSVLACIVTSLAMVTLVAQLLGSVGLFERWPLTLGCTAAGLAAFALRRTAAPTSPRRQAVGARSDGKLRADWRSRGRGPDSATLIAGALTALVAARWAIGADSSWRTGPYSIDSIQYHLPFAATFYQSGWLSRLHYAWLDPVWTFYPYGSETFHAIGMVAFGSDVLTPLLNLAWLALALFASWCCGIRWGAQSLTLALSALLFASPLLSLSQPGTANSDVACIALLLATAALLIEAAGSAPGYLVSGLAAGLAASTTLFALPPIAGLALGFLVFERRGSRAERTAALAGLVVAGAYWYLRNLIVIGNPVPGFKAGPLHLPAPQFPVVAKYGFSVAHYLGDAWFWKHYLFPGLKFDFGYTWPVIAVIVIAGSACAAGSRRAGGMRALTVGAFVTFVVYLVTPTSAYGPPGDPFLFGANLRFLLPAVAWLFVAAAAVGSESSGAIRRLAPRWLKRYTSQTAVVAVVFVLGVITLLTGSQAHLWRSHPLPSVAGAAGAAAVLVAALCVRRTASDHAAPHPPATHRAPVFRRAADPRIAIAAVLTTLFVIGGLPFAQRYSDHRYAGGGPIYSWASTVRHASIGTIALAEQYPLFGSKLDNKVTYVGTRASNGSLVLATNCSQWRQQLSRGRYDYVVIGTNDWLLGPIPQLSWTRSDPAARVVVTSAANQAGPPGTVFRLSAGAGTTLGCS